MSWVSYTSEIQLPKNSCDALGVISLKLGFFSLSWSTSFSEFDRRRLNPMLRIFFIMYIFFCVFGSVFGWGWGWWISMTFLSDLYVPVYIDCMHEDLCHPSTAKYVYIHTQQRSPGPGHPVGCVPAPGAPPGLTQMSLCLFLPTLPEVPLLKILSITKQPSSAAQLLRR